MPILIKVLIKWNSNVIKYITIQLLEWLAVVFVT